MGTWPVAAACVGLAAAARGLAVYGDDDFAELESTASTSPR
jgi:hypothetical protein